MQNNIEEKRERENQISFVLHRHHHGWGEREGLLMNNKMTLKRYLVWLPLILI